MCVFQQNVFIYNHLFVNTVATFRIALLFSGLTSSITTGRSTLRTSNWNKGQFFVREWFSLYFAIIDWSIVCVVNNYEYLNVTVLTYPTDQQTWPIVSQMLFHPFYVMLLFQKGVNHIDVSLPILCRRNVWPFTRCWNKLLSMKVRKNK